MGIMWHKQVTKNKACGSHVGGGGTWEDLKWGVCIQKRRVIMESFTKHDYSPFHYY
jgi:hypothetical protein